MEPDIEVVWIDGKRDPRCAADPAYPDGIDVDTARGLAHRCKVPLPYPALRCGVYLLTCRRCGLKAAVTTAGRPDDPRSIVLGCKTP
jgi:hypothetical protein